MELFKKLGLIAISVAGVAAAPALAAADITGGKAVRGALQQKFHLKASIRLQTTLIHQPPGVARTNVYQVRSGQFKDAGGKNGFFRMTSYRDPKQAPTLNYALTAVTDHPASWSPAVKEMIKAELGLAAPAKVKLRTAKEWQPPASMKTDVYMLRSGTFTTRDAAGKQISGELSFSLLRNGVLELKGVNTRPSP